MINLNAFKEALDKDIQSLERIHLKPLSAKEVYVPYIKLMGQIYLCLCVLATTVLSLLGWVGVHLSRSFVGDILDEVWLYQLFPMMFFIFGMSQGYILWRSIKDELHSAPYIQQLMAHYLKLYFILYASLLILFIVVLGLRDVEMVLMLSTVFSLVFSILILNMETQRLAQASLIKPLQELFSHIKAKKN